MKRIEAEEFMGAVDIVTRVYKAAADRLLEVQHKMGDRSVEVMEARKEAGQCRDDLVWLVTGLLTPASKGHALLAKKAARKLLDRQGGPKSHRSTEGGSPAPLSQQNASDRLL